LVTDVVSHEPAQHHGVDAFGLFVE